MVQINLKAVTSVVDQSSSLTNVEKRVNFFKKLRKMCLHVVKITSRLRKLSFFSHIETRFHLDDWFLYEKDIGR